VVSQHQDGCVEWGVLAPPAGPGLVPGPLTTAKHLASHDVGAHAVEDLVDDPGIGAALAAVQSLLLAPAGGLESPFVQAHATLSDRVLGALIGASDIPVEGHRNLTPDRAHAADSSRAARIIAPR